MGYQDRDWYKDAHRERERRSSVRRILPTSGFKVHLPSLFLGAFLAFLGLFVLNGFRFWF
jgi:hypothetical protein